MMLTEAQLFGDKHKGQELPAPMDGMPRGDLLLPYQQRSLQECSTHALLVIEKSRRVGLTWALAADAVLTAGSARGEGGDDCSYISYSQEMTREFIDACAMWAKAFNVAAGEVGEFLLDDADEHGNSRSIKAFRISFASGFEITALSSAPRSLRGRKGKVYIDEAAFVDNLGELLKAALALLMWGGRVIVISTHNGIDNPFNVLLDEIRSGRRKGATLKITLKDAIADGLYERVCLVTSREATPAGRLAWESDIRAAYGDAAAEELDCIPATGAGSFIDPALVIAAHHDDCGKPELYKGGFCVIGRDIAKRIDLDVIWIFELIGDVIWLRERREERKSKLTESEAYFDGAMRRYQVIAAGLDQTGMGEGEVERAMLKHGEGRVVGFLMTGPVRLDIGLAMKKRFEDGTIRIVADADTRADFRAVKRAKGVGDTVRLVNASDEVHADRFWACAIACKLAEIGLLDYRGYRSRDRVRKFDEGKMGNDADFDSGPGRMRMRADEPTSSSRRFRSGTF